MKTLALAAAAIAIAAPAAALEVNRSSPFEGDAAKAWAVAGPFCAIGKWHPALASCTETVVDGHPQRKLELKGGGTIIENEVARDDAGRTYSYVIVDSPLPVANYKSTLTVGEHTIDWSGTFDAKGASDAEAEGVIAGIYEAGIAGIKDALK